MNEIKLPVIYKKLKDGTFYAYCPDLKGVHATADSFEQAQNNIKALTLLAIEELYAYEKEELADADSVFSEVMSFLA